MKKLIVANWKMHPKTMKEAVRLARASDAPGVVLVVPHPFLVPVRAMLRHAALAAQDVSIVGESTGPYTGEVSAAMLCALGVRYAIVGHSERRRPSAGGGETDAVVAAKVRAALAAGIIPILCVGEPWSVRRRGIAAARAYVKRQMTTDLASVIRYSTSPAGPRQRRWRLPVTRLLIAYEPVWAISTSKDHRDPSTGLRVNETPEDAARMAISISKLLITRYSLPTPRILYGGSVNSGNVGGFLARKEFSGLLVGAASLKPAEFRKIITAAKKV